MTRCAAALLVLLDEVDTRNPNRDRRSDGGLASPQHHKQNPTSDHEPDANGVYHARDFDRDGINAAAFAEHIRQQGQAGDRRLTGGYVIFNRRIASDAHGWVWRAYKGKNGHEHHVHVSCTHDPAWADSKAPWGWAAPAKVLSTAPAWYLEYGPFQLGDENHGVAILRNRLHLPASGPSGDLFDRDVAYALGKLQHDLGWSVNRRCSGREARYLEHRATGR